MKLPDSIEKLVLNLPYTVNKTGMSGSEVRMYDGMVLKICPADAETENEAAIAAFLKGKLPVPEILARETADGVSHTLMTRVKGKMLCDRAYLTDIPRLLDLAAEALKKMWSVDITGCPDGVSRLENRLAVARYNVENGLVDMGNMEPSTFGPGGLENPASLIDWLENNRPPEDLVLTHGDCCLPNLFADENGICGYIDTGKTGVADRWQDIALCIRSISHNLDGRYSDGVKYGDFEPEDLLDRLGIPMDEEKFRYYVLLDELF